MSCSRFQLSAWLTAALMLAACDSGSSAARESTASFTAAADTLTAKLKSGQLPPPGDPDVKAFEAQSAQALKTLGTPDLPVDGFDSFQKLCGKASEAVGAYVNAGVQQAGAQQVEVINRNGEQLVQNMFSALLFGARCTAAHLPFIEKEVGDDINGKEGPLAQVRGGAFAQVQGLLEMAGSMDLDAERRGRVLDLLAADAGNFSVTLSAAQRQQLATLAESVRATLPEDRKGQVDKIKAGLTGSPCGELCKI